MTKTFPQASDYALLVCAAEPNARKSVALANQLPTGAIPVLAAVASIEKQGENPRSGAIYAINIGTPTLIRGYLADLVRLKLVERYRIGRSRKLRLTLDGLRVIGQYQRQLRAGIRSMQA